MGHASVPSQAGHTNSCPQRSRAKYSRHACSVAKRAPGACEGSPPLTEPLPVGATGVKGIPPSPLDLMHHLSRYGARLVETSAHRRFGWPGCCSHRSFKARRCLPGLLTDQSRELVPADREPHRAPARPRRGSPGCDPRVGEASEAGCRDYMAEVRYTNGPMSCSPSCYRA